MKKIAIFIAILLLAFGCLAACGMSDVPAWENISYTDMLPVPQSDRYELHHDDDRGIWVDIKKISVDEYYEYKNWCEEDFGFCIDIEDRGNYFYAFNQDGYYLKLQYNESLDELGILLDVPMKMEKYELPELAMLAGLPSPQSEQGYFHWNHSEGFGLYVGNISKDDFVAYKEMCKAAGFDVEYNEAESYYSAKNAEEYTLMVKYVGYDRILIEFGYPDTVEPEQEDVAANESEAVEETVEETELAADDNLVDGMRPEFKEAMDSYEAFFEEYCEFMKEYAEDPTDLGLLVDYSKFMTQYAETMEALEKWEDDEMNDAELTYYTKVMSRITKMLADSVA